LLPDGKEQAGIFAHGFRILDFMSNYALIFSFILLPLFSNMIRRKEEIAPLLRLASVVLIIPSLALLTGIAFYRYQIFGILYLTDIQLSANVFLVLIISYAGICISYTFGALLTANGNLKELNTMALIAVSASTILNIVLIPEYKVMGAAISNAIAQTFTIFYHVILVRKKFEVKIDFGLLAKIVVFICFIILLGWIISKSNLYWPLGCFMITAGGLLFSLLIKLFRLENLKTLFQAEKKSTIY
jgi:O-antigen/teichoic acid export membrane protein